MSRRQWYQQVLPSPICNRRRCKVHLSRFYGKLRVDKRTQSVEKIDKSSGKVRFIDVGFQLKHSTGIRICLIKKVFRTKSFIISLFSVPIGLLSENRRLKVNKRFVNLFHSF